MVDEVRLLRLLRAVADEVAVLEDEERATPARRADVLWLRGVKYAFVSVIEACMDAAHHICSSNGWGPPDDNGHAMRLLGEHGALDTELAARMAKAVGFRNLLVHDYARVDDDIVVARLSDLSDLREFVRQLVALTG